jgi:hypothetical protein
VLQVEYETPEKAGAVISSGRIRQVAGRHLFNLSELGDKHRLRAEENMGWL